MRFLYNNLRKAEFEKKEELMQRLKEVLLESGEVGLSSFDILGHSFDLIQTDRLTLCPDGETATLSFNRYDVCGDEPSYINFDSDKYAGIDHGLMDDGFGRYNHYCALLKAQVLSEDEWQNKKCGELDNRKRRTV